MRKTHRKALALPHPSVPTLSKPKPGTRFADFVPRGIPLIWTRLKVNARHIIKEYGLALSVTAVFLLVVASVSLLRVSQRRSLTNLLAGVTNITQDYQSLSSNDKQSVPQPNSAGSAEAPSGNSGSFAINTNASTAGAPGQNTQTPAGGGGQPVAAFTAAIGLFQQDSVALECSGPHQNKPSCSKRYNFKSVVNTQNGPGTVGYGWRSDVAGGTGDASYTAPAGSGQQTLTKSVVIACQSPGSYSMQFVILSPSQVQSATLTINHECNGI